MTLDEVVPNDQRPRLGSKDDIELQRQIEANEGVFEPLFLEPHPELEGKFRIIDGDRRWTNTRVLVDQGKEALRTLPAEITDRVLTDEQRLRVWIYIHRQRKEWDAKDKGDGRVPVRRPRRSCERGERPRRHRARARQTGEEATPVEVR